jgi:hypothetical protein
MSSALQAAAGKVCKVLTEAKVEAFNRNGYHFPVRVMSAAEADACRRRLELPGGRRVHARPARSKPSAVHLGQRLIRRGHPRRGRRYLRAQSAGLGSFFLKDARDPSYVSWHQDSTYWGLSHPDVVSAWIALSVSTVENGCMRVIPGTHLVDQLPHQDTFAENNLLSRGQEVAVEVNEADAVNIELQPGEFSLHHVRLVHGSDPNQADYRRLGYAVRYIPTYVKQTVGPRDCATLVRGVDNYHHFDMEPVPKADLDPEAVALHARVTEEANQILYRGTDKRNPK